MKALALSIALLVTVREGGDVQPLVQQLAAYDANTLASELSDEAARRAFWLNCYNAFVQILLEEKKPDLTRDEVRRDFFQQPAITVAGLKLSLNDIEHGMLRHSKIWWSGGYITDPFPDRWQRRLRVPLDYRIHFALNCGATSCPPIRNYSAEELDEELRVAEAFFLDTETRVDTSECIIYASSIFNWFNGDFGGYDGVKKLILRHHGFAPDMHRHYRLEFTPYDWTVYEHYFSP
ncbi:MAG: DUF547 domain-containing protein [Chitinophagales bacterium]|nr:DUF547 domain-containing protein [Chitinophagales bacterium]MDW8393398.1 DUF547 domain-containing protein [Chitinophagales bacterium]